MKSCLRCVSALLVLFVLTSCCDEPHEGDFTMPDGRGLLIVGLHGDAAVDNLTLYVFDGGGRCVAVKEYADPRRLASESLPLDGGSYTVAVVANADAPTNDITLAALAGWLEANDGANPGMLTASAPAMVRAGEVTRVVLCLKGGTAGMDIGTLRLHLTLPSKRLPDYVAEGNTRAAAHGYRLRCVAELCRAGTDEVVTRKTVNPTMETDSTFTVELATVCGDYDLRLWSDYALTDAPTADTYYDTENLKSVSIATDPYTADTDAKDAAYGTADGIALPRGGLELDARLQRPLAKYRIVATDVAEYRRLHESEPQKYPPVGELTVTVDYENFFPSCFNVVTGKPNDALTGIGYGNSLSGATVDNGEMQLCSDWVLVNGTESFVTATITITDKQGNVLGQTQGVRIDYRRGYLTTIRGRFLTVNRGEAGGGAVIDTEWDGEYVIEF